MKQANAACQKKEIRRVKVDYQDVKSAAYIDAIIYYAETLLGIRFKSVKKYRYSALWILLPTDRFQTEEPIFKKLR